MYQQQGMHGLFDSIASLGASVVKAAPQVVKAITPLATAYIAGRAQVSAARAGILMPQVGASAGYPQTASGPTQPVYEPMPYASYATAPTPNWLPYAALGGGLLLVVLLTRKG